MPLSLIIDALDSVPEALRPEYEPADGGKFKLKVEGLEDTTGLKSALSAERKRAREFEAKVKKWESLGKTDEEISELISSHEEAERTKAEKDGDHTKILKQHQDKWAKEKSELEAELKAARSSERNAIIENSIMAALTKAKATEEGLDLLPDRLSARIVFETVDGKRVLKIMQADGETPLAGSSKDGLATFDDLVKEAVAKWPSLFAGSGNGGGGKQPGSHSNFAGSRNAEFMKLSPAERINAFRAANRS